MNTTIHSKLKIHNSKFLRKPIVHSLILLILSVLHLSPNLLAIDKSTDKTPLSELALSEVEGSGRGITREAAQNGKIQGIGKNQIELVIQNGHSRAVNGIQLTKDEKKMISWSDDGKIKIWEMDSGKLLRTLEGHTKRINGILLSKDEDKLLSYSNDKTIKIWDAKEGKLLKSLEGHTYDVSGILLNKDESKLYSYSNDKTIKLWDTQTGKFLRSLEGHTGWISGILLSKDESKLFSYSFDEKTIKIWDTQTGKLLTTLEGHTQMIGGILLSKDESKLFSYSNDNTIKIWDMKTGKLLTSLEGHTGPVEGILLSKDESKLFSHSSYSYDNTIKIWDMKTGKLLTSLEGHTWIVEGILLSKDGSKLFSYSADKTIKIWDTQTGKLLMSLEGLSDRVEGIILSKYESKLFSYYNKTIKIRDMQTGKLLKSLEEHTDAIEEILLCKDESKLFSYSYPYSNDKTIKIWDTQTGKLLQSLEGHTDAVHRIFLSKDESKLFSYSRDTIKIWDTQTGKLLKSLEGHTPVISGILLDKDESKLFSYTSRDQSKVFMYSVDKTIKIWEMQTGKLLTSIEGHTNDVIGILLSKDESKLFSYSYDNTIKIWDTQSGKLLTTLEGHTGSVSGILLSKDESKLFSYSYDNTIKIWGTQTGKLLTTLEGHTGFVWGIRFNKDESKLFSYSADNTIKIWDMSDTANSRASLPITLNHNSSSIVKFVFNEDSSNPHLLKSFSSDGSIRYWDISDNGKTHGRASLLVTQLLFKNGESIYYTPDGYFDFTDKSVLEYITYVSPQIQNNFVDLQDLMSDYYVDGLLELAVANKFKPNKKNNLTKGVETTPMVKSLFDTQKKLLIDEEIHPLRFQVNERGSKLDHAVIYVNGVLVDTIGFENNDSVNLIDDSTEGQFKYDIKFKVPLNFGMNRVEVKVFNEYKIPQSFPAFEIQRKIPDNKELAKPDLYILSVGINDYKTKKLKFSVPDAKAMAEAFEKGKTDIYREVHTSLLVDAKKKDIEDAFLTIEKKARPQDVVLVYFSGHGMNAFTREGKKLFYFVPQDFKWPSDPENENVARLQGIDADYLDETFTKIKSHKLILILDACHSGSVNTALASRGQDKEKATRKAMEKMANGTGRFIFASSSGNEESREHEKVGHGLYTYVLLNALGKNKDKNISDADSINKDGFIYLSEIRSYIEQQFEEQTAKYLEGVIQTPPSMSLGRSGMHERVNDFPLLKAH